LSSQPDPESVPASPARGIAAQIVANTSLLIAILVYMGWAWDDAYYGYFHLNALDLNFSIVDYMLRSLDLFSIAIIVVAVVIIFAATFRAGDLGGQQRHQRGGNADPGGAPGKKKFARRAADAAATRLSAVPAFRELVSEDAAKRSRARRRVLVMGTGAAVTLTALALNYWIAKHVHISTYLFLFLLGGGVLLLAWPIRADRHGRFPYAMAIVVSAVCALWAASLYAHNLGIQAAKNAVQDLSTRTAVLVYSIEPLALVGPGLTVQSLPATYRYHYRYQGLRLLLMQSGTYYLVPVGWSPQYDLTYILDQSDPIRIELLGAHP
jgi:hypothetical protein